MILLKRITLENFLSHPLTDIPFDNNEKLLVDGVSGSGKSSILEAIVWCLYGKGRVENRSLVLRGKKAATVTLELTDGDVTYQIVRGTTNKAKNTLSINILDGSEWKSIERMGLRDQQDWIENHLLHASYALFVNSIAYMQDNGDTFVKQTAARRKELLLEILRAGEYADLYKKSGERLNIEIKAQADLQGQMRAEESLVASLKADKKDMSDLLVQEKKTQEQIAGFYDLIKASEASVEQITTLESMLREAETEVSTFPERISSLKVVLERIVEEMEQIEKDEKLKKELMEDIKDLDTLELEYSNLKKEVEAGHMNSYKLQALMSNKPREPKHLQQIADIEKQLLPLRGDSSKCPSGDECPFTQPILGQIEFLESEIKKKKELQKEYEAEVEQYEKDLVELTAQQMSMKTVAKYMDLGTIVQTKKDQAMLLKNLLEKHQPSLEDNNRAFAKTREIIKEHEATVEKINKKISDIRADISKFGPVSVDELKEQKRAFEYAQNNLRIVLSSIEGDIKMAKNNDKMIAEHEAARLSIDSQLATVNANIDALVAVKEAFSQRGIPAVVIDYVIPRLEERINEILAQLSDFRIRIETQRQNSTGDGMVEGLYLNIYNELGEEFDFDSYSGGQKLKITVAIAEALASLQKVGFRLFDEVFLSLDEQSTEEFTEVMDKLQSKFNQIICITHLRNVKDLFEDQILVIRKDGTSIISP